MIWRILLVVVLMASSAVAAVYFDREHRKAKIREIMETAREEWRNPTPPPPPPPPAPRSSGQIKVKRVWDSGYNNGITKVLVAYENNTANTFGGVVTVQCIAMDKKGEPLNQTERSFYAHERGAVGPGFKGTLEMGIMDSHGAASAECSIIRAE